MAGAVLHKLTFKYFEDSDLGKNSFSFIPTPKATMEGVIAHIRDRLPANIFDPRQEVFIYSYGDKDRAEFLGFDAEFLASVTLSIGQRRRRIPVKVRARSGNEWDQTELDHFNISFKGEGEFSEILNVPGYEPSATLAKLCSGLSSITSDCLKEPKLNFPDELEVCFRPLLRLMWLVSTVESSWESTVDLLVYEIFREFGFPNGRFSVLVKRSSVLLVGGEDRQAIADVVVSDFENAAEIRVAVVEDKSAEKSEKEAVRKSSEAQLTAEGVSATQLNRSAALLLMIRVMGLKWRFYSPVTERTADFVAKGWNVDEDSPSLILRYPPDQDLDISVKSQRDKIFDVLDRLRFALYSSKTAEGSVHGFGI